MPSYPTFGLEEKWKDQPLWRTPPQPEMQHVKQGQLPAPEPFFLHPLFVWFPTKTLLRLTPTFAFPCINSGDKEHACRGVAKMKSVGLPRLLWVVGVEPLVCLMQVNTM